MNQHTFNMLEFQQIKDETVNFVVLDLKQASQALCSFTLKIFEFE